MFVSWMEQHQLVVLKVARVFAEFDVDQDDLAQEIRLAIWKSIPSFNNRSKVSTYIYRIALNRAITWQRSRRSYRNKMEAYAVETSSLESNSDRDPRLALVYQAIRRLDRAERSIMLMYLEGFKYGEIAETLGLNRNHVGVLISRIKTKLGKLLKGEAK